MPSRKRTAIEADGKGSTDRLITRAMSREANPAIRVSETEELLDTVLVHLPMGHIFTVQRVSKRFSNAIRASVAIQRKLPLQTTRINGTLWSVIAADRFVEKYEFIQAQPNAVQSRNMEDINRNTIEDGRINLKPVMLDPLFKKRTPSQPEYYATGPLPEITIRPKHLNANIPTLSNEERLTHEHVPHRSALRLRKSQGPLTGVRPGK